MVIFNTIAFLSIVLSIAIIIGYYKSRRNVLYVKQQTLNDYLIFHPHGAFYGGMLGAGFLSSIYFIFLWYVS